MLVAERVLVLKIRRAGFMRLEGRLSANAVAVPN